MIDAQQSAQSTGAGPCAHRYDKVALRRSSSCSSTRRQHKQFWPPRLPLRHIGQLALQHGAIQEAARRFRFAAGDCPRDIVEGPAASVEVAALDICSLKAQVPGSPPGPAKCRDCIPEARSPSRDPSQAAKLDQCGDEAISLAKTKIDILTARIAKNAIAMMPCHI